MLSLFTGVGQLDRAVAEVTGAECVMGCDIDPMARHVMAENEDLPMAEDVRVLSPPRVDIVAMGSPCQDLSLANHSGRGLQGSRSGLLYDGLDVAGRAGARWVFIENVPAGRRAIVEACRAWRPSWSWASTVVAASEVGAPHRRKRVFVVGSADFPVFDAPERTVPAGVVPTPVASEIKAGRLRRGWKTHRLGDFVLTVGPEKVAAMFPDAPWSVVSWRGRTVLNPEFAEWCMLMPAGLVTGVWGVGLPDQLRLIGNSVVEPAAELAFERIFGIFNPWC